MNSKEKQDHDPAMVAKFYITDPQEIDKKVNEPIRHLLREYSGVPEDEVVGHVLRLRDAAFQIYPYACVGSLRFLDLSMCRSPFYPEILARLKKDNETATLLDLGCCFAQDLRQLVQDGVSSSQLYGLDIEQKFLDLSYDLFLDRGKFRGTMLAADVEAAGNGEKDEDHKLVTVKGKIDIIWAASFFHLFTRPRQLNIAKKLVELLRPVSGSMLLGRQLGSVKPGDYDIMKDGRWQYRHSPETLAEFWEEVGRETGTKWRVEATVDDVDFGYHGSNMAWGDPDMRRLLFKIVRE